MLFARRDVQIDPKTVRTDFELLVPAKVKGIRLKENFRDVAVPELVAASVGLGIRKNGDDAILRLESHKKRLRSPEQPYFRLSFWIGVLALPVRVEVRSLDSASY